MQILLGMLLILIARLSPVSHLSLSLSLCYLLASISLAAVSHNPHRLYLLQPSLTILFAPYLSFFSPISLSLSFSTPSPSRRPFSVVAPAKMQILLGMLLILIVGLFPVSGLSPSFSLSCLLASPSCSPLSQPSLPLSPFLSHNCLFASLSLAALSHNRLCSISRLFSPLFLSLSLSSLFAFLFLAALSHNPLCSISRLLSPLSLSLFLSLSYLFASLSLTALSHNPLSSISRLLQPPPPLPSLLKSFLNSGTSENENTPWNAPHPHHRTLSSLKSLLGMLLVVCEINFTHYKKMPY